MTDDHFARLAILESALAQAQADLLGADGRIQMAVQLYEAEKASHTRTLAELALVKEALAASEAERKRWEQHYENATIFRESAEHAAQLVIGEILDRDVDRFDDDLEMAADEAVALLRREREVTDPGDERMAYEFIQDHGDWIWETLCDPGTGQADSDAASDLEELLRAFVWEDDDAPTEPMAAKEPT